MPDTTEPISLEIDEQLQAIADLAGQGNAWMAGYIAAYKYEDGAHVYRYVHQEPNEQKLRVTYQALAQLRALAELGMAQIEQGIFMRQRGITPGDRP